jgi:phage antirepressor YoqD-like protein
MNQLIPASNTATMSSLEMAELTGKRHDNVKRTIQALADSGVISHPQIEDGIKSANGVVVQEFRVTKRDSFVVVAQLCPEFTARLVDRWQELEAQVAAPVLPSYAETLRLYADSIETNQRQAEQLAIAAPKVEALDRIATADGAICITSAAKHLQMRPKDLFAYLKSIGWIYRRAGGNGWLGYAPQTNTGLLEHKVTVISRSDGSEKFTEQVLVTGKGMAKLALMLESVTA